MELSQLLDSVDEHLSKIKKESTSLSIKHVPGKKLRSQLLIEIYRSLVGAYPNEKDFESVVQGAVAIELVHDSSLIVDDIFDNGSLRRGHETLHTEVGQNQALLVANIFLMSAGRILVNTFNPASHFHLVNDFFDTAISLATGEMEQQRQASVDIINPLTVMDNYRQSVEGKTSSLFTMAIILGVLSAGEGAISFAKALGSKLGIAFQMKDDYKDIFSDEAELQKDSKNDLSSQKLSFPICYLIEKENLTAYDSAYFEKFDFRSIQKELQECYHTSCKEVYALIQAAPKQFDRTILQSIVEKILGIRFQ